MREKKITIVTIAVIIDLFLGLALDVKPMVVVGVLIILGIFTIEALTSIFKY